MINRKNNKKAFLLSLTASIGFIIFYIITKNAFNLILSTTWLIIGLIYLTQYKKKVN